MITLELTELEIETLTLIVGLVDPASLRAKNNKLNYMSVAHMEAICDSIHPLFEKIHQINLLTSHKVE